MSPYFKRFYVLSTLGLMVAGYLLFHYTAVVRGYQTEPSFCNISDTLDCETVARSSYASFAGIPVAGWAIVYYLLLFAVLSVRNSMSAVEGADADRRTTEVLLGYAFIGLIPSVALLGISALVIHKYCLFCLLLDLTNLLLFLVALKAPGRVDGVGTSVMKGISELAQMFFSFTSPAGGVSSGLKIWGTALAGVVAISFSGNALETYYFLPHRIKNEDPIFLAPLLKAWHEAKTETVTSTDSGTPLERDFSIGNASAPLTVIGFSDFECPYCKETAANLEPYVLEHPNQVRYVFRNYPLDMACNTLIKSKKHEYSCKMATMARCAGLQSDELFWKMHDALMKLNSFGEPQFDQLAAKVGVKSDDFKTCMDGSQAHDRVVDDINAGAKLVIQYTPTLFFNGKRVQVMPELVPGLIKNILKEMGQEKP